MACIDSNFRNGKVTTSAATAPVIVRKQCGIVWYDQNLWRDALRSDVKLKYSLFFFVWFNFATICIFEFCRLQTPYHDISKFAGRNAQVILYEIIWPSEWKIIRRTHFLNPNEWYPVDWTRVVRVSTFNLTGNCTHTTAECALNCKTKNS